jgi:uncharacterized protein YjlB
MATAIAPMTLRFADDGAIPNNTTLPLVLMRAAVNLVDVTSPEDEIERVFGRHGWGRMWRNGFFPYVHYHSMIHEALGVARGGARVRFGGDKGEIVELAPGDVAILPAGTGHQCLVCSDDFSVVGAYPKDGEYNLFRGEKDEHAAALKTIPHVPLPDTDPVYGKDGPLVILWQG